jgi:hypothetical protein
MNKKSDDTSRALSAAQDSTRERTSAVPAPSPGAAFDREAGDAEMARLMAVAAGGARQVQRAIAEAVSAERERAEAAEGKLAALAAVIPPERFRMLADWFDTDDEAKMSMFPETWPPGSRSGETQDDLRKFADLLEGGEPGNG